MAKARKTMTRAGAGVQPGGERPIGAQDTGDTTAAGADRERIARRAYELYERRGRSEGKALDDWLSAERELQGRSED
jgi:hypothetical protein